MDDASQHTRSRAHMQVSLTRMYFNCTHGWVCQHTFCWTYNKACAPKLTHAHIVDTWWIFGPFGGQVDFVLHTLWVLRPCDPRKCDTTQATSATNKLTSMRGIIKKKKREKNGQADRLGCPPPPPPPPKRSGKCKNFSTSCHIWGYFAIL